MQLQLEATIKPFKEAQKPISSLGDNLDMALYQSQYEIRSSLTLNVNKSIFIDIENTKKSTIR